MSAVVLDASALLAMLRSERGADKVAGVLATARISVFNFAEVASHYFKLGMPYENVTAMLRPLPVTLVPADTELAWEAARLRPLTVEAGLSLGDRFCLALAKREALPAWTADQVWRSIGKAAGVKVVTIR